MSASRWCVTSGLSRTYVSTLKNRLKKDPMANTGRAELTALARTVQLDPAWLLSGVGEVEREEADNDPYPARAQAIILLRSRGVSDAVLEALRLESVKEKDAGERRFWLDRAAELVADENYWARKYDEGTELAD